MRGDWLRLHYHAPKSPKVMALPSDAARWAWIVALCEAKQQTREGEWASEAHLRAVLGRHAKHLQALIEARLVVRMKDGRMLINSWNEWQTDFRHDPTHAERQRRYRERVTSSADVTVTSPHDPPTDRPTDLPAQARARGAGTGAGSFSKPGLHDGKHGPTCSVCAVVLAEEAK